MITSPVAIIATILIIPIIFYQTTMDMVNVWNVNETFTHGYLIFPATIWMIWQRKAWLTLTRIRPEPLILLLLVPLLAVWLLANMIDVQVIEQLCLISLIPAVIWALYGRRMFLKIFYPLLFLLFAVPLGQELIPQMMTFTANFTVTMINLTGIPVYQDGLYFILPSGSWSVVEECSGVRYLIASTALGTLYAYIFYTSRIKRIAFIALAIIIPILANGLRAFGTVMIGHFSGMKLAIGVDHLVYGWVFFGIIIFVMFFLGSYWRDANMPLETDKTPESKISKTIPHNFPVIALLILGLLFGTKAVSFQLNEFPQSSNISKDISLPDFVKDWVRAPEITLNWSPEFSEPHLRIAEIYRNGKIDVQLDVGYYRYQRQGAEAVSTRNRLTDPHRRDWQITSSRQINEERWVTEFELRNGDEKLLVWRWYRIGDQLTSNPYRAKLIDVYNRLLLNRRDASILSLATRLEDDLEASRRRLKSFNRKVVPEIYNRLEKLSH